MLRSDIKIDFFSATDHLRCWREITDGLPVRASAPGAAGAGDAGSDRQPVRCVHVSFAVKPTSLDKETVAAAGESVAPPSKNTCPKFWKPKRKHRSTD
ncbi:hypothetical protein QQF64_022348 [Cirrhinus molitorella]|uniref:Uncharacterized protein n=1 Tax=Cirrhinus molitorella TaxID=172907 RepID=A0ABR3L9G3_9TELE